jgi:hypothetical protein
MRGARGRVEKWMHFVLSENMAHLKTRRYFATGIQLKNLEECSLC